MLSALHAGDYWFLGFGLFTALLTAFYMGRATFLTFFVEPGPNSHSDHAHESPWVMTAPLATLAVLALAAGFIGSPITGYWFAKFLGEHEAVEPNWALAAVAVGLALLGIGLAWASYIKRWIEPDGYFRFRFVSNVLAHKFWLDEVYELGVVRPMIWIAGHLRRADHAIVDGVVRSFGWVGLRVSALLAVFDREGVDGTVVDGLGDAVNGAGEVRRIHTGNVQTYLILLVAAIVLLVVVFAR